MRIFPMFQVYSLSTRLFCLRAEFRSLIDFSSGKHQKEQAGEFTQRIVPTPSARADTTALILYNPDPWYCFPYPSPLTRGK